MPVAVFVVLVGNERIDFSKYSSVRINAVLAAGCQRSFCLGARSPPKCGDRPSAVRQRDEPCPASDRGFKVVHATCTPTGPHRTETQLRNSDERDQHFTTRKDVCVRIRQIFDDGLTSAPKTPVFTSTGPSVTPPAPVSIPLTPQQNRQLPLSINPESDGSHTQSLTHRPAVPQVTLRETCR